MKGIQKMMSIIIGIVSGFGILSIPIIMFIAIPRFLDWVDLNLSKNYLENRAEKKVRDLRTQIRTKELEKEAIELEKKLSSITSESGEKNHGMVQKTR